MNFFDHVFWKASFDSNCCTYHTAHYASIGICIPTFPDDLPYRIIIKVVIFFFQGQISFMPQQVIETQDEGFDDVATEFSYRICLLAVPHFAINKIIWNSIKFEFTIFLSLFL